MKPIPPNSYGLHVLHLQVPGFVVLMFLLNDFKIYELLEHDCSNHLNLEMEMKIIYKISLILVSQDVQMVKTIYEKY